MSKQNQVLKDEITKEVILALRYDPNSLRRLNADLKKLASSAMTFDSKRANENMKKAIEGLAAKHKALAEGMEKDIIDAMQKGLTKQEAVEEAMQRSLQAKEYAAEVKRLDLRIRRLTSEYRMRERYEEQLEKKRGKYWRDRHTGSIDSAAHTVGSTFQNFRSAKIGKIMRGAGESMDLMGGSMTSLANPAAIRMLGAVVSGLGASLTVAGAAVAALVSGFLVLERRATALNKVLVDGTGIGVGLSDEFGEIDGKLNQIRKTFSDFDLNYIWATSAKDHLEILKAYEQAGMTFKEMKGNVGDTASEMQKYVDYSTLALKYSRLLGVSSSDMASNITEYMNTLGVDLEQIENRFSALTMAASGSGLGVKNFYSRILQATTGLSMYNVRLEQSASLLSDLHKIVGQEQASRMLQQLNRGGKDESTRDRTVKALTTGVGRTNRILQKDSSQQIAELRRDFAGNKDAQALFESFGLVGSDEDFARTLSSMDNATLGKFLAESEKVKDASGKSNLQGFSSRISSAHRAGLSFRGDLRGAQASREDMGPAAKLLTDLSQLQQVLGVDIDQIDSTNIEHRMAFENITGKSGAEARALMDVGMRFRGRYNTLKDRQKVSDNFRAAGDTVGLTDYINKNKQSDIESYGAYVDEAGQIMRVNKQTGQEYSAGNSFEDFMLSMGSEISQVESSQINKDTIIAQNIGDSVDTIENILERIADDVLERLYDAVMDIVDWLPLDGKSDETLAMASNYRDAIKIAEAERGEKKAALGKLNYDLQSLEPSQIIARYGSQSGLENKIAQAKMDLSDSNSKVGFLKDAQGLFSDHDKMSQLVDAVENGSNVDDLLYQLDPELASKYGSKAGAYLESTGMGFKSGKAILGEQEQTRIKKGEQNAADARLKKELKESKDDQMDVADYQVDQQIKRQKELELGGLLAEALPNLMPQDYMNISQMLVSGNVDPSYLKSKGVTPDNVPNMYKALVQNALTTPAADDMLLQIGANGPKWAHRVDKDDVGIIAKPGGGLSSGSGASSNTVVHNHMYNDARGNWNSIRKFMKAYGK